jgi:hypothetical protein
MINYIEKGEGLHLVIADAGYTLKQVDGTWVSDNDVEVQSIIDSYVETPEVPQSVSPAQFRVALNDLGFRLGVEAYLGTASQNVRDYFEYATYFERNNQTLVSGAQTMGLTDSQIDSLFIYAGSVSI